MSNGIRYATDDPTRQLEIVKEGGGVLVWVLHRSGRMYHHSSTTSAMINVRVPVMRIPARSLARSQEQQRPSSSRVACPGTKLWLQRIKWNQCTYENWSRRAYRWIIWVCKRSTLCADLALHCLHPGMVNFKHNQNQIPLKSLSSHAIHTSPPLLNSRGLKNVLDSNIIQLGMIF